VPTPATLLDLPPDVEVELEIRIFKDNSLLGQGIMGLDREVDKPASFSAVSIAVQAGAYEALKAVWPWREE